MFNEFYQANKARVRREFGGCSFVLAVWALIGLGLLAINWPW